MSYRGQNFENEDYDAIFAGFQIIDASCFELENEEDSGLQIHPKCLCPICGSYKNKFLCSRCINGGYFTSSNQPNGYSYAEMRSEIVKTKQNIEAYNISIMRHIIPDSGEFKVLSTLYNSLRTTIAYVAEQNRIKRSKMLEIRKSVSQCRLSLRQLTQRRTNLASHFQTLKLKQLNMDKELLSNGKKIEYLRNRYVFELLGTYFPVTLAMDSHHPDQFVGASLHVDKENIFIGPEPMLSSSAALTYCVPAINAATVILDIWLPSIVRQSLHLSGPFLAVLPQRDNLGRVYSAVLHAVHMLCSSRNCDVRRTLQLYLPQNQIAWRLQGAHSVQSPLLGLHCLNLLAQMAGPDSSYQERLFDEPYALKLDGIFSTVQTPNNSDRSYHLAVNQLQLEDIVEQGEEIKESDELDSEEHTIDEL